MRIVSLIDDPAVIERILKHLGLWPALRSLGVGGEEGVRVHAGADPPSLLLEPWLACPAKLAERRREDPLPDYDTEPIPAYVTG